jgi:hypothetical protein
VTRSSEMTLVEFGNLIWFSLNSDEAATGHTDEGTDVRRRPEALS